MRHADTDFVMGDNDQKLNAKGLERANALVRILGNAGITVLFSTGKQRTIQTVQPLAEYLKLEVNKISDEDTLVSKITSLEKGNVAFIVGHAPTIPEIIRQLGGNPIDPINEFDNMYVITLHEAIDNDDKHISTSVLHLKYGN